MARPRCVPAGISDRQVMTPGTSSERRDLVDVVGPLHIPGLHGQVELVADVGPGRTGVGGGAVSGPGVAIDGVQVAAVAADAEDLGLAGRFLRLRHGAVVHQLGFGGFAVESDGDGVAVQGAPGLDVGAVDRDRARGAESSGTAARASRLASHLASMPAEAGVEDVGTAW